MGEPRRDVAVRSAHLLLDWDGNIESRHRFVERSKVLVETGVGYLVLMSHGWQ